MTKVTYRRRSLFGVYSFRRIESMTIMIEKVAVDTGAAAKSSHLDIQPQRRETVSLEMARVL